MFCNHPVNTLIIKPVKDATTLRDRPVNHLKKLAQTPNTQERCDVAPSPWRSLNNKNKKRLFVCQTDMKMNCRPFAMSRIKIFDVVRLATTWGGRLRALVDVVRLVDVANCDVDRAWFLFRKK